MKVSFSCKNKRLLSSLMMIVMFCTTFITSCQSSSHSSTSSSPTPEVSTSTEQLQKNEENEQFEQFLTNTFKQWVASDSISLHYSLTDPKSYGIETISPTFGSYGEASFQENIAELLKIQKQLSSFSYETLSARQQEDYDILSYYINESLEGNPYLYYETVFSPVIGLQAQLPILLAEYRLETKEDIEHYLALLSDLDRYLKQLLSFEQVKAEKGLGMQDFAIEDIQKQCNDYVTSTTDNCLITSFQTRLSALVSNNVLTNEEKQQYLQKNSNVVLNEVLPAYESLVSSLETLKGKATIDGGLRYLKNGTDYYSYLIKTYTGVDTSPSELKEEIESRLQSNRTSLVSLLNENPNILNEYESSSCPIEAPNEILSTLQEKMKKDFPKAPTTFYELKTVDSSLSEHVSPAFYLTPPIDNVFSNVIYINSLSSSYQSETLYPTLAHEGYPGHLYQNTYFYSTNPNPIRSLLNFEGYSEGWATYVEYHCYEDIDYGTNASSIAKLQQYEMDLSLGLCSLVDIGVNANGWNLEQCEIFLSDNGITDPETALSIYQSVIEEPANYLKYYVGFLQFESLRSKAMDALQENFDLMQFHKIILDLGPAPFSILEHVLEEKLPLS